MPMCQKWLLQNNQSPICYKKNVFGTLASLILYKYGILYFPPKFCSPKQLFVLNKAI